MIFKILVIIVSLSIFGRNMALPGESNKDTFTEDLNKTIDDVKRPEGSELMDSFLTELDERCSEAGNVTVNFKTTMHNMSRCTGDVLNTTNISDEIRESIPTGNLNVVFRKMCLKWPLLKNTCFGEGLKAVNQCWGKSVRDQLLKGMDTIITLLCGN